MCGENAFSYWAVTAHDQGISMSIFPDIENTENLAKIEPNILQCREIFEVLEIERCTWVPHATSSVTTSNRL